MIVGKYILLFTCLGIGVALCVGAISILRSSTRQRATGLVCGGARRDVLLGSFCAVALEAPTSVRAIADPCPLLALSGHD